MGWGWGRMDDVGLSVRLQPFNSLTINCSENISVAWLLMWLGPLHSPFLHRLIQGWPRVSFQSQLKVLVTTPKFLHDV